MQLLKSKYANQTKTFPKCHLSFLTNDKCFIIIIYYYFFIVWNVLLRKEQDVFKR